jgi:hypothetical protein
MDLDSLLNEYYDVLDYTREGVPTPEKLRYLGIEKAINDVAKLS